MSCSAYSWALQDYQNGRLMFGSFDSINFNNSFQIDLTYLVNESGLNENKNWAIT